MRELLEFAKAVWLHGAAALTGGTTIAVLTLWGWFGRKGLPIWASRVIAVILFATAFFRAWRDEHRARLRERDPRIRSATDEEIFIISEGGRFLSPPDKLTGGEGYLSRKFNKEP